MREPEPLTDVTTAPPQPGRPDLHAGTDSGATGGDQTLARARSPYTTREKVARVLWIYLGQPLFRITFHDWYGLRNAILRAFGADIARPQAGRKGGVRIRASVSIEQPWNLSIGANSSIGDRAVIFCLGQVTIGDNVSISQHAHLCAGSHDYRTPDLPLLRVPITIEDHAWIGADAFVGPGVTVHEGAILGARGATFKDLEPWRIYGSNPARPIKARPRFDPPPASADRRSNAS